MRECQACLQHYATWQDLLSLLEVEEARAPFLSPPLVSYAYVVSVVHTKIVLQPWVAFFDLTLL